MRSINEKFFLSLFLSTLIKMRYLTYKRNKYAKMSNKNSNLFF